MKNFGDKVLIGVGLILCLVVVGFIFKNNGFTSPVPSDSAQTIDDIFLFKPRECGLILGYPRAGEPTTTPIRVTGYANGCGWKITKQSAGLVRVLNESGQVISNTYALKIVQNKPFQPSYFDLMLPVQRPGSKQGTLLFLNNGEGDEQIIERVPITFK